MSLHIEERLPRAVGWAYLAFNLEGYAPGDAQVRALLDRATLSGEPWISLAPRPPTLPAEFLQDHPGPLLRALVQPRPLPCGNRGHLYRPWVGRALCIGPTAESCLGPLGLAACPLFVRRLLCLGHPAVPPLCHPGPGPLLDIVEEIALASPSLRLPGLPGLTRAVR